MKKNYKKGKQKPVVIILAKILQVLAIGLIKTKNIHIHGNVILAILYVTPSTNLASG